MKTVRDTEGLLSRSQQVFAADSACAQAEWKLPDQLRADWEAATTRLQQTQDAITPAETARTREQQTTTAALDEAEDLIRDTKRRLRGLLRGADLQTVLTAYQLDLPLHRITRDFVVPRLRSLSTASAGQTDGDTKLPDAVLQRAAELLTEIETHQPSAQASLAERKTTVAARNEIIDEICLLRRRAYFHLCTVLPDMDDDPRLEAYGFGGERTRHASHPAPQPQPAPATTG